MATIDNLQLSIEATDRASSKIESLAHALSSLKGSVPSASTLNNVAKGIKDIADSANSIDGRTMNSVASKVTKLASALNAFQTVPNGTNLKNIGEGVKNLTNALSAIDGRSATSLQTKLTKLGTGLSAFPKTISTLKNVASGISEIATAVDTLSEDSIQRIERLGNALQGFRGLNVRGVTRLAQSDVGAMQPQRPAGSMQEVANGNANVQRMTINLEALRNRLAGVATTAVSVGMAITRAFATTAVRGFRLAVEGVRRVINTLTAPLRNLVRSLGRIAFYRVIRSLIKEIGQGLKEGIQNLAQFSKLMNELDTHSANRVMSLYASNLLYFKNAVATAVIPILKSLEPIFDSLINKGVELINVMAQLFSFLSGSSTYTRAKYFYVDYAESLDKASGSAGKLNKQLAQFDELNNLTTSSGSGKDNALDYLKMFEDPIPIEDWIKNLDNQNWEGFGKKIADKITETLSNIDWVKIKEKAGSFGRGFAGFLNGFLDEDMFSSIGSTLAEGLNTAVKFAFEFGNKLDETKIAKSISRFINSFFTNFDFYALGNTLKTFAIKVKNALKEAFDDIDWVTVFDSLTQFLDGVGFTDLIEEHHTFFRIPTELDNITKEYTEIFKKYKNKYGDNYLEQLLSDSRNVKISNNEFADNVAHFFVESFLIGVDIAKKAIGGELPTVLQYIYDLVTGWKKAYDNVWHIIFNPADFEKQIYTILDAIKRYLTMGASSSFDNVPDYVKKELGLSASDFEGKIGIADRLKELGGDIINGIIAGIENKINGKNNIFAKIFIWFLNGIKNVFEISSPAKKMYPIGENIVLGIIEGFYLVNIGEKLAQWFNDKIKPLFSESKWKELGNSAKNGLANIFSYSNFYNIGDNAGKALYNAFATQLNSIVSAYNTIKSKIESNPIVQTIKTTTVGSVVGSGVTNSVEIIQELVDAYNKTPAATTVDGHKKGGADTKTWHTENFPAKPAGMSSSAYASYIENWKKNNMKYPYYYASGGFPTMGSMFVAGERGAELVGNINGRTGVANTLQIEDAMYQAVYDATSRALSENEMSVTIEGDMDKVFRVMQNKSQGFYTRTGRPAF